MLDATPKAFVLVLMPFHQDFNDVYQLGIKQACKDAGAYCERIDEQLFVENILERLYNQIAKADVIIADMTGRNPNVFYEVGYAHALNKQVILCTKDANDIPFDLKHYPHIVYGNSITALKSQLQARVVWCISHPQNSLENVDINLNLTIDTVPLVGKPMIDFELDEYNITRFNMNIAMQNLTSVVLQPKSFSIALLIPTNIPNEARISVRRAEGDIIVSIIHLPDDKCSCNMELDNSIFPNAWYSFPLSVEVVHSRHRREPLHIEAILRVFTQVGSKDYPLVLRLCRLDHDVQN